MPPESEKKVFKAAIINADELVKAEARDVGDARMTESKEDRSGNWFAKMGKRIWKHNLAQEWYRQREISRVKKDILKSGNIYKGEKDFDPDKTSDSKASEEALQSIIERFTSEYEEDVLKESERDSKETVEGQEINAKIKELIKKYAGSQMTEAYFEEEKKRILSKYDKNIDSKKNLYTDNLLSIAKEVREITKEVRESVSHGAKLAELDFEVQIILGKARESLSTEAHQNSFDKGMEKLQNSKIGKYLVNEPVALATVAGLYDLGRNLIQKTFRSKAVQWGTFGLAAVASGGISAMKERARITRERAQHQRESAKGMKFKESDMKRRREMEENSYETREATAIIADLKEDLSKVKEGNLSEQEVTQIMARLADLESRIKLNDQEKIDLITYDKFSSVEKDRTTMDITRAELKVALRNSDLVQDFDTQLHTLTETQKTQLLEGDRGIEHQDEVFRKLRNKKAWKAAIKTTLIGGSIGAAAHEGGELIRHSGAMEALHRWFGGGQEPSNSLHEVAEVDNSRINAPEGVEIQQNPDDTISIIKDGHDISGHVPLTLDAQGNLSQETQEALAKSGITSDFGLIGSKTTETIHESAQDFVKNHAEGMRKIHRELWYDNDTPHPFNKNELRTDWAGENHSGIDAKGNYVFNVSRMTSDGSFHGSQSVDVKNLIAGGKLKMLFSLSHDTQHQVFEVNIDSHGNAIVDPNSELGKLMFETHNGHAVFTGKFAEVAESRGLASDGGENVRILGTHIGHGKDVVDDIINKDTTAPNINLHISDDDYGIPIPVPIAGRRPLEKGEYEKNKTIEQNRPVSYEDRETVEEPENKNNAKVAKDRIPAGSFRSDVAENIKYSAKTGFSGTLEEKVEKGTNHIYGFVGFDREAISQQLKSAKKYSHPQMFIFETDASQRATNLKKMEYLKRWHPKVRFTYVALPKRHRKFDTYDAQIYSKKRLEHILKLNKVDPKVKHEIIGVPVFKPLGDISPKEFEIFMDTGRVSGVRLQSIAHKIKTGGNLTNQEQAMRAEQSESIEKLLKKDIGAVSYPKLHSIVEKIKAGEKLSDQEQLINIVYRGEIEKISSR